MQLFKKTNFDFIGKRYYAYAFSAILIGAGLVSLVVKGGPKLGIDFTGGTMINLQFKSMMSLSDLRQYLAQNGYADADLQDYVGGQAVSIRLPQKEGDATALAKELSAKISERFPQSEPTVLLAEFVGPAVGRALSDQALKAIFWSLLLIIIYVAFRFKSTLWGFCSIAALIHDVISVVGIFSILDKEITVTVVAAILTLAGYSMNDTIVIYDRMRENLRLNKKEPLGDLINRSINETLSRTVMTSLTVAIVLVVLYFFGGRVIHDFAFAMLYGVFVGSYSTIFVASPIIYEWHIRQSKSGPMSQSTVKNVSKKK